MDLRPGETALKKGRLSAGAAIMLLAAACASPEQRVEKYTKSGLEFLEKGDLARANIQFQNALKINEEHVPALVGVAEIAEKKQDFSSMFAIIQQVVRLAPQDLDAQVKLGKLYLVGGDEKSALEAADKALALKADDADALSLKAAVQLKLGDRAGAVELAQRAVAIDPSSAEAVAVLATDRANAKDFEGALAVVDAGLAAKKDHSVLHLMRLQLLSNLGRKEQLIAAHEELIKLYPETVAYRQIFVATLVNERRLPEARAQLAEIVKLSPGKIEPVLDVVRLDYRSKSPEAAKATFSSFVDAEPKNIDLKFAFASFLRGEKDASGAEALYKSLESTGDAATARRAKNEIAALRLAEGKREEARKIVDAILAEDARDSDALLRRASIRIDDGALDEAITDLRTVIEDKPDSTPAKLLLATAFEKKGDFEYASSQMAQAVIDSGNAAQASNLFAKFLIRRGDASRAEKTVLDSLAKHPQDLDNLKLLAAVRLMQQNWRGAEETAKLIETLNAGDESAGRILGAAYTGLQDYSSAIEALSASNEKAPLAAQPLAMLVNAYAADGRAAEAEAMLAAMIEKDPSNYEARLLLAQTLGVQRRSEDIEKALQAAIEAAPARPEAVEALYRVYRGANRDAEAGALVDAAAARAPANDGFKVLKADFLLASNRAEDALAIYADLLSRRPNNLLVVNNYASLLLELKTDAESRAKALAAAKPLGESEFAPYLDTLGWAQYHSGDYDAAAATLQKAVAQAPDFYEAKYHLGAALIARGEVEAGKGQLAQAIEKGGEAGFVAKARELLARN
jgi:Tfp pilus assembly protein PilF